MAYRKILLKGDWRHEEYPAAAAVTPGMLLEVTSSGTIQAHSTQGGRAERLVAEEDALQGKTVSDDYSAGDPVMVLVCQLGTECAMLLAVGENVSEGDELVSNGDGAVIARTSLASAGLLAEVIARAGEAQDNSGGSAAVLTKVRII